MIWLAFALGIAACCLSVVGYHREWDLTVVRLLMHPFGVHTAGCRGRTSCEPTAEEWVDRSIRLYRNGWWRR